jgi:hypothetical protein
MSMGHKNHTSKSTMKGKGVSVHGVEAGEGLPYGRESVHGPNAEEHDASNPKELTHEEKMGYYGGKQWTAPGHEHGFPPGLGKDMPHEHTIGGGLREFWQGHGADKSDIHDHLDGSASSEPTRPWHHGGGE